MADEWELVPDDGSEDSEWELVPDDSSSFSENFSRGLERLPSAGYAALRGLETAPYRLGQGLTGAYAAIRDQFRDQNQEYEPDWVDVANKYANAGIEDKFLSDVAPENKGIANFTGSVGKLAGELATGPFALPMMAAGAGGNRYVEAREAGAERGDATRAAGIQAGGTAIGAKLALPFLRGGGSIIPQSLKSAGSLLAASVPMTYADYLSRTAYTGDEFTLDQVMDTVKEQAPETLLTGAILPGLHRGINKVTDATIGKIKGAPGPAAEAAQLDAILQEAYGAPKPEAAGAEQARIEAPPERLGLPAPERLGLPVPESLYTEGRNPGRIEDYVVGDGVVIEPPPGDPLRLEAPPENLRLGGPQAEVKGLPAPENLYTEGQNPGKLENFIYGEGVKFPLEAPPTPSIKQAIETKPADGTIENVSDELGSISFAKEADGGLFLNKVEVFPGTDVTTMSRLQDFLKVADEANTPKVTIETDPKTVAEYEKLGFQKTGRETRSLVEMSRIGQKEVPVQPEPTIQPNDPILEPPTLSDQTRQSLSLEKQPPIQQELPLRNPEEGALKIGQIAGDIHDVANQIFSTAAKRLDSNRGFKKLAESERFVEGRMDKQVLPREAVKQYRQLIAYPETIAQKAKEFRPIYEAAQQRIRTQSEVSAELHGTLKPYWDLAPKNRAKVDKFLIDEREAARKAAVNKTPTREIQPSQLEQAGWTPEEIAARSAVRTGMQRALQYVGHALRSDAAKIKEPELQQKYIEDVNKFMSVLKDTGYVPFSRYGKGFEVTVKDKTGTQTLYRKFFDSRSEAKADFLKQEKVNPNQDVTWGERASMRPDAYDDLPGHIVGTGKEFNAEKWTEAAKQRQNEGFTKHFIRAALTPGYETNLTMSLADYVMGLSKFYARKMSMPQIDKAMSDMNPDTHSELRAYSKRYIKDLDKGTQYQNAVMNTVNFWTLAGVPMSAITNLTQPLTTTYPALQAQLGAKAPLVWSSSLAEATGAKPISDPMLQKGIDIAIKQGVLEAQAMNELRAFRRGDPTAKTSLTERAMLPFKIAEKFNRKHAFISGWKVAESQGAQSFEQKLRFAEDFVGKTQFVNNQANLPEIARSVPGRIMLQYKTSYVGQMLKFLRTESTGTAMTSLGMLTLIGGVSALPFMKEFLYAAEGQGYDPKSFVRKFFDDPKLASTILSGVPATSIGLNMSGSAGMGEIVPAVDEKAGSIVKSVAGPAGDVFYSRPLKAMDLAGRGQYHLAAETIAPRMVRGISKIARIQQEGGDLKDSKGRVMLPQATALEQAYIGLGGTPQRLAESNEVRDLQYRMEGYYKEKMADLNERARNARANGDWEELDNLQEQLDQFNAEYGYEGKLNSKPRDPERKVPKAIRRTYEEKKARIRD